MACRVKRSEYAQLKSRLKAPAPDNVLPPARVRGRYKLHHDWNSNGVLISDHAVIRFMQHVYGVDPNAVRALMVDPVRADAIRVMGNGKLPVENNCRLVVRNMLVVTCVKSVEGDKE